MKLLMHISIILLCSYPFYGQQNADLQDQGSFSVTVNRDTILLGNSFDIVFNIENINGTFEAPDFADYQIVGGPNRSSSMSIINGHKTQKMAYSYTLKPKAVGKFFIAESYLETDKNILETLPMTIIVLDNPNGIIQENEPKSSWMDFGFGNRETIPHTPDTPTLPKKKKLKTRKF